MPIATRVYVRSNGGPGRRGQAYETWPKKRKARRVRIQWGIRIRRTLASVSPTLSALRFRVSYMSSPMGAEGMLAAGGAWSGFALGAIGILSLHPAVPPHPICMPPDAFIPI